MKYSPNRRVPLKVLDNPALGTMGKSFVLSGGLGGATQPGTEKVGDVPFVNRRVRTFMEQLQIEVQHYGIDLTGVCCSPFICDVSLSDRYLVKDPNELVFDLQQAILVAAEAGQNSTPLGLQLSGGQIRGLLIGIKKIIEKAKTGEMLIIGLNVDPSCLGAGRPGGMASL